MKHSLGKLRMFTSLHRSDPKDKSGAFPPAQHAELAQASKDMQSIKNCYDSLLSAAAATANSAYEFSESLQEMGECLIEKTTIHGDEDSGRVLAMLGKVQFELQQLVDTYRSHIFLTITNPSESFLNELRRVEEMKKQCDEKRDAVEYYMMAQQNEKGRKRSGKGDSSSLQLQKACEEYEDEANLCVFRLKSLKQGQSRSLLTQAARHHAAQMSFFKKGLKSLEAVDSDVKLIAQLLHIDYDETSEIEEDDVEDDGSNGFNVKGGGELSYDSISRNSMEVDDGRFSPTREERLVSHSAPIFPLPEKKTHLPLPMEKPNSYVLPMPREGKGKNPAAPAPAPPGRGSGSNHNLWHSSPLELKENMMTTQPPPPISDSGSSTTDSVSSDMDKFNRQAFSGPLTSKNPVLSPNASPPLGSSSPRITELHELPLPPLNLPSRPVNSVVGLLGHSAPLVRRNLEGYYEAATNRIPLTPSPLPPPFFLPRSFSIPSSSHRAMILHNVGLLIEPPYLLRINDVSSPPFQLLTLNQQHL